MRIVLLGLLAALTLGACSSDASTEARSPAPSVQTARPDILLPAGPLRDLVPATADLPPGMVAILAGSGARDVAAIAEYSADPVKARTQLVKNGFRRAYTAQYADPLTGRVLSVVVTQFATATGARDDLQGDLSASSGTQVEAAPVGEQSDVRRQLLPPTSPSPGAAATASPAQELVTVRFRQGLYTWLVAYGSTPPADVDVALMVARALVSRAAGPA